MQRPRRLAQGWLCCLAWCHSPSWGAHAALRRAAQHWEPQQAQIPPGSDVYYVPAPKLGPGHPEVMLPALKAPGQYVMQPGPPFAAPPPAAQQPPDPYEEEEEEEEDREEEPPEGRRDPNDDLPLDSFMPAPAAPPVRDTPMRPQPQSTPMVMTAPPAMEYQPQSEPMVMEPPAMEIQQQSAAPMVMMPPAMMPAQAANQQVMQVGWAAPASLGGANQQVMQAKTETETETKARARAEAEAETEAEAKAVKDDPLRRISNYFENCHPKKSCRGNGDRVLDMHDDIDQLADDCATPGKVIESSGLRGNGERLFRGSVELMQEFQFMRGSIIRMGLKCFMDAHEYRNKFATFGMIDEVIKTMRDAALKNTKSDHMVTEAVFRDSLDIIRKFAEGSKLHQWQAVKAGAAEAILPEMQKYGLAPKSHACPALIALYNHYQADMLTATVLDTQCEVALQSPSQWPGQQ